MELREKRKGNGNHSEEGKHGLNRIIRRRNGYEKEAVNKIIAGIENRS